MNSSDTPRVESLTTYLGASSASLPADSTWIGSATGEVPVSDNLLNCCLKHEKEIQTLKDEIQGLRWHISLLSSQYASLQNLWYKKFEE